MQQRSISDEKIQDITPIDSFIDDEEGISIHQEDPIQSMTKSPDTDQ